MNWCRRVGGLLGDNIRRMEAVGEEGGVCPLLLSGPQQPCRKRGRLVTGGDAALIALSRFHAHFRETAITSQT